MELIPDLSKRVDPEAIEVAPTATPLDFLQAIYRSADQPMPRRLRAAMEAAQFVHPKLAVTASLNGGDFADQMEKAFSRSAKVIEHQPQALSSRSFRRA
jgi:hypothetical protein